MKRARQLLQALIGALAIATASIASAGQTCEAAAPDTRSMTLALGLAERLQQSLDASGAQVVVVARAGQDLRKYGLTWSHLAFAYREDTPPPTPIGNRPAVLGQIGGAIVDGFPVRLPSRGT